MNEEKKKMSYSACLLSDKMWISISCIKILPGFFIYNWCIAWIPYNLEQSFLLVANYLPVRSCAMLFNVNFLNPHKHFMRLVISPFYNRKLRAREINCLKATQLVNDRTMIQTHVYLRTIQTLNVYAILPSLRTEGIWRMFYLHY